MGELSVSTCWTVIRGAAAGNGKDKSEFSHRYLPVVRSFLASRWQDSASEALVDDAVQNVFLECFREQGILVNSVPERIPRFRAFLFGVVKKIALRTERTLARQARMTPGGVDWEALPSDDEALSTVFDRAWARSLVQEAAELYERRAAAGDREAQKEVELLKLRFDGEAPVREIAARWGVEAGAVHRMYRRARRQYRKLLRQVVAFHHPGSAAEIERECSDLLSLLR